jgi:restriction system protein
VISRKVPDTWQNLQTEAGRLLKECGFDVEVEKKIETARGTVEVDVYAVEVIKGRKYVTLCECKHWKSNVPQNTVHGFRTVMGDFGANQGYIVSMAGFQEGAYKATENTNVRLVTWVQLLDEFSASWMEHYFFPTITETLDPLLSYTEPFLPAWFDKLSVDDQGAYLTLKEKYDEFGWMIMSFTTYHRMFRQDEPYPELPIRRRLGNDSTIAKNVPKEILDETHHREFLEVAIEFGTSVIKQFQELRAIALKEVPPSQ